MKNFSILLFTALFLTTSCSSSSAEKSVEKMCDCVLDAGIEDEYDIYDLDHDEEKAKEVIKCVLPILKDVRDELDNMDDEERAEYFGDAIKAYVDCECGQKLLEVAAKLYDNKHATDEFDHIIEELEEEIDYPSSSLFNTGPTVCECVTIDHYDADEDLIEACEEMEQEWKEKFEYASEDEKEEMMKEIEECL